MLKAETEKISEKDHKTFICCFSLQRDELAMWNYYTKDVHNQGYNLGFNFKELVISVLRKNPELHGCKFTFGKVDYCIDENTYASQVYHQSIANINDTLSTLISLLSDKDYKKKESEVKTFDLPVIKYYGNEPMFRQYPTLDVLYFMKRPCFSTEAEFRIAIQINNEALEVLKGSKKYKYRVSNGLLIPYLDLEIDMNSMTGIALSPTINSDLAERSIRDYCNYCNIDTSKFSEGLIQSNIPVRF